MEMKKIFTVMVAGSLVFACAACGKKDNTDTQVNQDGGNTPVINEETPNNETPVAGEENPTLTPGENIPSEENKPVESKPEESKPVDNKPADNKPADNKPADNKPADNNSTDNKPVEELPAEKPQEEPKEEEPTEKSVGNILLDDFKAKADSASSMLDLAESLRQNSVIPFMSGAMEIEEGFLSGFDNAEIKGFKSGASFGPMIGSIPFIGYVFELENAADVPSFISLLESNANLRWNICVQADEMVSGSIGNKVFFVMAPTHFGK
ncbi:MAG: hypothetical protein J6M02_02810 [Clostridia bacterium]|nr:hypothetical protein [Clostridia bacterium]